MKKKFAVFTKNKSLIFLFIMGMVIGIILGTYFTNYYFESLINAKFEAAIYKGYDELGKKKYFKAIEFFSMGKEIKSNRYESYLGLGSSYKGIAQNEIALDNFKKALNLIGESKNNYALNADTIFINKQIEALKKQLKK